MLVWDEDLRQGVSDRGRVLAEADPSTEAVEREFKVLESLCRLGVQSVWEIQGTGRLEVALNGLLTE